MAVIVSLPDKYCLGRYLSGIDESRSPHHKTLAICRYQCRSISDINDRMLCQEMILMKKIALLSLLVAATTPVFAKGLYAVGSIGRSVYTTNSDVFNGADAGALSQSGSNKDSAYQLGLGYQLNQHLSVEGSYVNLGQNSNHANLIHSSNFYNDNSTVQGINLDVVGTLPLSDRWGVYGKLGGFYSQAKTDVSYLDNGTSSGSSNKRRALSMTWGGGVSFNVTEQVSMRLEYEQFRNQGGQDLPQGNVNLYSLGMAYKF